MAIASLLSAPMVLGISGVASAADYQQNQDVAGPNGVSSSTITTREKQDTGNGSASFDQHASTAGPNGAAYWGTSASTGGDHGNTSGHSGGVLDILSL